MLQKLANNTWGSLATIAALALLLFVPYLGGMHLFDWDEINFAEAAREMLVLNDYLRVHVGFHPFWEKPPLFIWLQAASMHLFGVGEFAARFPNAVCGVATLCSLYLMGRQVHSPRFGLLWALVFGGSVLPFFYFKSGIIDPWFNLWIYLGLYALLRARWAHAEKKPTSWAWVLAAGLCTGLGVLTKGPVALLVSLLVLGALLVLQRLRLPVGLGQGLLWLLVLLLVPGLWFGLEYLKNGPWFITTFTAYQWRLFSTPDAGHQGFLGYHFVVLLLGCFPASIFAIRGMRRPLGASPQQFTFWLWNMVLFWVVLLLFSYIKTKIVHYSSLCYLPLSYLATTSLLQLWDGRDRLQGWMRGLLWGIGILLAILPALFVLLTSYLRPMLQPLLAADPFAQGNLEAEINWWGFEWLLTPLFLLVLVLVLRWWRQGQLQQATLALFGGTAVFTLLVLFCCLGRAESISQQANIEFMKSLQGKDCYIITKDYKSFAHLFYTQLQPSQRQALGTPFADEGPWHQHLLYGQPDKPVYVSAKIGSAHYLDTIPGLQRLYARNGFVFYRR